MEGAKSLLQQINMARAHPQYFIQDLYSQLSQFQSENCMKTSKGERVQVIESGEIWRRAAEFLEGMSQRRPLSWSQHLCNVACEYEERVARGQEVSAFKLLKEHYDYNGNISFNTCQSEADQSAREMVLSMIVDDGDLKRGNRKTLFEQGYRYFGGLVTKRDKVNIIVMFFSDTDDFRPKGSGEISSDIRNLVGFGRNAGKVLRPNENTMEVGIGNVRYETEKCVRGVDNFPSVENMIKRVQFAERPLGVISLNEYLSYDRVPMKTTVKSSIVNRLGRTMKVKKTVTEYDDGSVEETETEIMI